MLVAKDLQHDIHITVNSLHGVGLRVVRVGEHQPDAGASESLLHHLGLEIRGIVHMYLQWMAKPSIQHLQGAQYLVAGGVAEKDGLEPLAEDILQSEQVLVAFGTDT